MNQIDTTNECVVHTCQLLKQLNLINVQSFIIELLTWLFYITMDMHALILKDWLQRNCSLNISVLENQSINCEVSLLVIRVHSWKLKPC